MSIYKEPVRNGWWVVVLILCVLALLGWGDCRAADETRIYDEHWNLKGYVRDGTFYDRNWNVKGHIQGDKVYDPNWSLKGRIEGDRIYDKSWNLKLREDNGRIYDRNWRPKGHIERR